MLYRAKMLRGGPVYATDGLAGRVERVLFDDTTWAVRHLVIRMGGWFSNTRVLGAPTNVQSISCASQTPYPTHTQQQLALYLNRTQQELANLPDLMTDPPVADQQLMRLSESTLPFAYCPEIGLWANHAMLHTWPCWSVVQEATDWDAHLWGCCDMYGYALAARDATFGAIDDVLVDVDTWRIRYVMVRTGGWWNDKRVVIAPHAIRAFSWNDSLAVIDMWRADIEQSLAYDQLPSQIVTTSALSSHGR